MFHSILSVFVSYYILFFQVFFLILLFLKSFSVYTIHFYYTNIKDDIELHVLRSVWSAHNCLHFIIYWSCICHSCQYSMPLYNTNHLLQAESYHFSLALLIRLISFCSSTIYFLSRTVNSFPGRTISLKKHHKEKLQLQF